jgi:RNA polymerase sigma-54 factor
MILTIREIIEKEETVERMLTDDVIADKMKTLGFDVARRTIAKYRERGGIPPKNIRKQRLVNRATSSGGIT